MTTSERNCFICDEGYNGEIPCPQCNTAAWNAYHEEHKQVVTVVERGRCSHSREMANVQITNAAFVGWYCAVCQDVMELTKVAHATAETVE